MTEEEIRQTMNSLHDLLGTWHKQIEDIAAHEAIAAWNRQPLPYQNLGLEKIKANLVQRSELVVAKIQSLHDLLVAGDKADRLPPNQP